MFVVTPKHYLEYAVCSRHIQVQALHLPETATRGHQWSIEKHLLPQGAGLQAADGKRTCVDVINTFWTLSSHRLWACSGPKTGPGSHTASLCLITTLLLCRVTKTSPFPSSIHCLFTGKHDTDVLLLCSFTTLKTQKTTNHQYTAQYARWPSVSVAWSAKALLLCRGSLPWNLFEVIVPFSSSLYSRLSSQQVPTVRNYL